MKKVIIIGGNEHEKSVKQKDSKSKRQLGKLKLFSLFLVIILSAVFGGTFVFSSYFFPKEQVLGLSTAEQETVLATNTRADVVDRIQFDIRALFNDAVVIKKTLEVAGNAAFNGNVTVKGKPVMTALLAGSGLAISAGNIPTIINTGVLSFQGETGKIELEAGEGITIDGLTITNEDPGSSQNIFKQIKVGDTSFSAGGNNDTLTFGVGTGLTVSTDTSGKKITFSSSITSSQWTTSGTNIYYNSGNVGIGTTSPSNALDVVGTLAVTGGLTIDGTAGLTVGTASCVTTRDGVVIGTGSCEAGIDTWTTGAGFIYTANSTSDVLFGGNATASAKFAVLNLAGGTPAASISANSGNDALYLTGAGVLGTTNAQTLTLGSASTGDINFFIGGSNNLRINGSAGATVSSAACVITTNGVVTGSAACPVGSTASPFQASGAVILQNNTTQDLLLGGTATNSAKFGFINMAGGTPTATIAGNIVLDSTGSLQTTRNQLLTLGGDTTGNIILSPLNGSGIVTSTGIMNLASGKTFQIAGADVLSGTALGAGVTGSSLTSVGALASGSIASGFGVISTGNAITGTTLNASSGTLQTNGTIRIDNSGNLANIGTTQFNTITYTWPSSGQSSGFSLVTNGSGALSWSDLGNSVSNYWRQVNGTVYTANSTVDLLVGGTSSMSAVFKVSPSGTSPTASIAGKTSYAALVVDNQGNGDLFTASSSGLSRFVIAQNGNVGIGTTTLPAYGLDVATKSAAFNSEQDGSLGSWSTNSNALPATRQYPSTVTANGYVYTIGGFNGSAASTVYYAKLNADGSVGQWLTTTALPATRFQHTSVVANGFIYVIGGSGASTVYYSKLNADGTVGSWATTTALPATRATHSSVVANGYVYVIGGSSATTVYYSKLNADGTVGSWTTTTALPQARSEHKSVVANGFVYAIGGYDSGGTSQTTVYSAKLNTNGSIGPWIGTTSLPAARYGHSSVVVNGHVYVIGGTNASGTVQSTVYYAKLNADGTAGSWVTNGSTIPAIRTAPASVVSNGFVYVIGGFDTTYRSTVYYASSARVLMSATLDLIGLTNGSFASASANSGGLGSIGGSIYAGDIFSIGNLEILGASTFQGGAYIRNTLNADTLFIGDGTSGTIPAASVSASTSFASMLVTQNGVGDIFSASKSGSTKFVIQNDGSAKIWLNTQIAATSQRLCHSGVDGSNQGLVTLADCNDTSADYAEQYGATDASIEAGDVVAIDPDRDAQEVIINGVRGSKAWIVKANKAYQSSVIGIISTEANETIGKGFSPDENPRPVALNGRVPVKISSFSAEIKRGDLITSSYEHGKAMKATKAGQIIGKALGNWNPANPPVDGKIYVFVNTSWYDPGVDSGISYESDVLGDNVSALLNDEQNSSSVVAISSTISGLTVDGNASVSGDLRVKENALIEGVLNVVDRLMTGNLIVNKVADFFGNAIFHKDVEFRGIPFFSRNTVGTVLIKKGEQNATVIFERAYEETPLVTVHIKADSTAIEQAVLSGDIRYVAAKQTTKGFAIKLNKPANEDITFSWTAFVGN